MVFSLSDPLEDEVEIKGTKYKVDLSFDNILDVLALMSNEEISGRTRVDLATDFLFGKSVLDEFDVEEKLEIYKAVLTNCLSLDLSGNKDSDSSEEKEQEFDFEEDAEHIYSSFFADYQMDLIEKQGELHWLKFLALFNGLSEKTKFSRVLSVRTMEIPKDADQKVKKSIREQKELFALKKNKNRLTGNMDLEQMYELALAEQEKLKNKE